jgi:hypothetical protein
VEHLFLGYINILGHAKDYTFTHVAYGTTAAGAIVTAHPLGLVSEPGTFYEAGGLTGIMGRNGMFETLVLGTTGVLPIRVVLHFAYNTLVVFPTLIAFFVQANRVHSAYLAKAIPTLTEEQLISTTPQLDRRLFKATEAIVRQGETADAFYILTKGQVEVVRKEADGQEIVVGRLGPGQYFGEIGLMHNVKRVATVRAVDDVEVMALTRNEFSTLIDESDVTRQDMERALKQRVVQIKALQNNG